MVTDNAEQRTLRGHVIGDAKDPSGWLLIIILAIATSEIGRICRKAGATAVPATAFSQDTTHAAATWSAAKENAVSFFQRVAKKIGGYPLSQFSNHPDVFVSHDGGKNRRLLMPGVDIGAADAAHLHLHQNGARLYRKNREFLDLEGLLRPNEDRRFAGGYC
jgi:hypothetical protein